MWWTAIKTFFGDKVMSSAGIFIGIFAIIIGVFIFSNSNVILSKFGFETATNLKAEVTRLQGELETAQRVNKDLQNNLAAQETRHKAEIKALVESAKEREKIQNDIIEAKKKKEARDKATIEQLNKKTVVTDTTITIPIAEYDQLSASNADNINEVFDSFFPDLKEPKCLSNCS